MKKIVLLLLMTLVTKVIAQESCGTKFLKIEEKLAKQYHEQLKDYKKYNLGICSKEDAHHEIVMLIPYIKKVEKYKNILSFLIAIVDNKHQIKESYLHKDAMKTSYISYLFKIDIQSYKSLLTNRPFAIIVEDVLDGPPTSSISKLFVYKRNKQLRPILSNLIIEESDEEMADFSMQRKATLKSLQDSSSYQTLTFKDKFYYGVEPYAISPNVKNSKDFEWSVKLDDIICHYKNKKYTCMRKPVFNLDKIEANTKKGWRYRKIVLLAMLHEEPLSEKNIKFYNNIAYNLREHKHQDESKFLSNILKRKFPEKGGILSPRLKYLNNNLEKNNFLHPIYRKMLSFYIQKFIDTSKINIQFYKPEICTKKDESLIRGLMTLYLYYYAFVSLDTKNQFGAKDINFQGYSNRKNIKNLFQKANTKQIENYMRLIINHLKQEDSEDVFNILTSLRKTYTFFKKEISKKKILELNKKHFLKSYDINMNTKDEKECLSSLFNTTKLFVDYHELDNSNYTTFNDFVYTFWLRRYNDGTIENVKLVIDAMLNELKKSEYFIRKNKKFKEFKVNKFYTNPNKPLVQRGFGRLYRTRLKKALKEEKPNFAGKYIITQWGCDEGEHECTTGGIIDASTGKATEFPFKYYKNNKRKGVLYTLSSSLIMFFGDFQFKDSRKEKDALLMYEFKDGKFLILKNKSYKELKK